MTDLFGNLVKPKREVKPPAVHLDAPGWVLCGLPKTVQATNDLERVTCLQCLARVNSARKRVAKIEVERKP